jgi:hypothetical protein
MGYLHCPCCARLAWLEATAEPPLLCDRCETTLAPVPAPLVRSLHERFERDLRLDAGRPRFVRS